jgi:hypothetical protein
VRFYIVLRIDAPTLTSAIRAADDIVEHASGWEFCSPISVDIQPAEDQ